ncbi:protein WHAT'S THIS FACTOR 9, mitochondrial isoform X1 [Argentina anserina]|uniref:protein WHAT'S THIS FACTOR 9, mitochondrial isoform X1 n=1 Tax=Argentina anserina TaxID=57926 RepID=UPI0021762490|nr:protein WHAT'S THIS FACTOR 9, mitochondrial isoform X1 [Potentilla anserina]
MVMYMLFSKFGVGFLRRTQVYNYQHKRTLVNVKLKWVKDRALDAVVSAERDLKAACVLVSIISSSSHGCLPIYHLTCHRGQLGLPYDLKVSTFVRRYPSVFLESHVLDSGGTRVPCFSLTPEAIKLQQEESNLVQKNRIDILNRLQKLLMLTRDWKLPLQTVDQLKWDLGLPYDYQHSVIPHHPDLFSFIRLLDDRVGLKLLSWDDDLAVSQLQKNSAIQQEEEGMRSGCLAFPIGFTRGFGLKRKCMEWLKEWQSLPYHSPYYDASHLDPRTDESEKRIVGVFHELLHLTIQKKTERKNVSNLRKPLALPQKFTKVFERHPGIFYISKKCDTQTVILREAYDHRQLLQKHPIAKLREKFAMLLRKGLLDRSNGLYKKSSGDVSGVGLLKNTVVDSISDYRSGLNEDSENDLPYEYESDELHNPC